jgi:hypothetical protein
MRWAEELAFPVSPLLEREKKSLEGGVAVRDTT